MKILKIFGIVLAVHAAAFMFVFAIPGCRSTTRRAPSPSETAAKSDEKTVYYPGLTGYSTTTPPAADGSSPVSNADLNPGIVTASAEVASAPVAAYDSSPVRFNPTRPNTPTASALQTAPVTDVQQVTTYTVAPGDSPWKIARKHGISVRELNEANNLKDGAVLAVGKKLVIPSKPAPSAASEGGVGGDTMTYTVKSGDSLGLIARRAGTTPGAIKTLNKMKGDLLTVGQKLILPANSDTASALAATPAASPVVKAGASDAEYVVQPNENLGAIARRFGVTQRAIITANHITDPNKLRPGMKLVIPGGGKTAPTSSPAPAQPAPQTPAPAPEPAPVSPVSTPESGPVSSPLSSPPVVPVESSSPISSGT